MDHSENQIPLDQIPFLLFSLYHLYNLIFIPHNYMVILGKVLFLLKILKKGSKNQTRDLLIPNQESYHCSITFANPRLGLIYSSHKLVFICVISFVSSLHLILLICIQIFDVIVTKLYHVKPNTP
jgi:hypothetical protein